MDITTCKRNKFYANRGVEKYPIPPVLRPLGSIATTTAAAPKEEDEEEEEEEEKEE